MTVLKEVNVDLGERSYPILIGTGLLDQSGLLQPWISGRRALIVSNEVVAPLYLERLKKALDAVEVDEVILPDGEAGKHLDTVNRIYDRLLENRHERSTTLIALGGGVTGDITGFAAATYQRGVNFIQVPTTLLAQVDSSVGGKTGVNHALGKNMIGAFHQPQAVLADTEVLQTLPERELAAGLAEIIKYGLIRDASFFEWLESSMTRLLAHDSNALTYAIEQSCRNKAEVVAADERESGQRALLNLGHTFGHAIETGLNYQDWLHGEAVATGMVMAADLSQRLGWIDSNVVARITDLIRQAGLPVVPPASLSPATFRDNMAVDKKARDGRVFLVLLNALGDAVVTQDYADDALNATLEHFCRLAAQPA